MHATPRWDHDGTTSVIRNPTSGDVYHLQPWGGAWALSGTERDGAVYWILPDGRAIPREARPDPVAHPSPDAARAALQAHWDAPDHGRRHVPAFPIGERVTEKGRLTEAFVDVVAEILTEVLRVIGPYVLRYVLHESCTPGNVDRLIAWLSDPANEDATWRVLRVSTAAGSPFLIPILFGPGEAVGRGQLRRVFAYLKTPEGQRIARSAVERACVGGKALAGVAEPRVAPGVATQIAQRVERCGCVEACPCVHRRVAADLRAFDRAWTPVPGEEDDVERLIERAAVRREPTVNVRQMWRLATRDLYKTDDLVSLAVRESLQNSVDSLRRAVRTGKIRKEDARFDVRWEPDGKGAGTLAFEDNGVGMNEAILVGKFLELGSSGKEDEPESGGGFGMAKAAILGASPTWSWEIHTQDRIARSDPGTMTYDLIDDVPRRDGFRLVLRDVPDGTSWSGQDYLGVHERLRRVLAWSHVPDVALRLDGVPIESEFPARRGSRLSFPVNWGPGIDVEVKGYKRADTGGTLLVRLKGLLQFTETGIKGMQSDIVLEVETKIRPGGPGYPFPPSRDGFRGRAWNGLQDLRKILTQESRSGDDDREYDDLLPDSTDPREREGAALFDKAMQDAADDPEIQALLRELQGVADEIVRAETERTQEETRPEIESRTPSTKAPGETDAYDGWRAAADVLPSTGEVASPDGRKALTAAIDVVVQAGPEAVRQDHLYAGSPAEAALDKVERGLPLDATEGKALLDVLQAARPVAAEGNDGSGVGRAVTQARFAQLLTTAMAAAGSTPEAVREVKKKAKDVNPFGSAAMVKVSRRNFDPDRAKAFLKASRKWIPYLVAWESVLRLVHREGRVRVAYTPGFVLDDTVNAVAFSTGESGLNRRSYVLVNPFKLQTYVETHRDRPYAVANWVFTIACHEISHLPHMGKRHDEDFIVERETLQLQTGHLVPAMTKIIARSFKLADSATPGADERKLLRDRLAKAEAHVARLEKANDKAARELNAKADAGSATRLRRTLADRGDWDPVAVVDTLVALGRAETIARWALGDAGRASLGPDAIPLARALRGDPDVAIRLLRSLPRS